MTSRDMDTPHITVIGSALSGNKGAAAMLESAIQTLGRELPGARFTLLSMYPNEDRLQNEYENLEITPASPRQLGVTINLLALLYRMFLPLRPIIRRRSRAIGALTSSHVLLDQGGITFTDGREKFLLYNVASILPAIFVRTPIVKCAQAVGPFASPINRLAARYLLPKVHSIVTRGAKTHEFASGLGLSNLVAGADYAFSLELDGSEAQQAAANMDLEFFEGGSIIGVSPSVVLQKKVDARGGNYVRLIAEFIDHATSSGRKVVLLPHSVRSGTSKTHNNDLPLCTEIFEQVSDPEQVLFVDKELPSQVLRYLIGKCDIFVASRFHAMVSALAMAVPTLVVGWSHKYQEVLEMFDAEDWAIAHDDLSLGYLIKRFEQLSAEQATVAETLSQRLPEVKKKSYSQAELIATLVRNQLA